MAGDIEGQDQTLSVPFPQQLDEWIAEDSTVRVIDVLIEGLDLKQLGFDRAEPAGNGRPGFEVAPVGAENLPRRVGSTAAVESGNGPAARQIQRPTAGMPWV